MRQHKDRLLRNSLKINAVFSAMCGFFLSIVPAAIAAEIGLDSAGLLRILGLGLLMFAGYVYYTGTRELVNPRAVMSIVIGDFLWIFGSVWLLFGFPQILNDFGRIVVIAVALAVLVFADLQAYGLWRSRRTS